MALKDHGDIILRRYDLGNRDTGMVSTAVFLVLCSFPVIVCALKHLLRGPVAVAGVDGRGHKYMLWIWRALVTFLNTTLPP